MTIYIVFMMIIFYFFVDNMWGMKLYNDDGSINTTDYEIVNTMIFEAFIFMHLFNEINCRKVGATDYNVFHNIFANWYFIIVVGSLMILQILLVEWGGKMVQTVSLSVELHAFCILWGYSTIIASALLKLTPA